MDIKKNLRLKFRKFIKENVTKEYSITCGESISRTIQQEFLSKCSLPSVSVFISKFPEISTAPLIDNLYSIGAQVYVPAWHSEEMWMCHVPCRMEFDAILKRNVNQNKIPMPSGIPVPINSVIYDFIIIPGLVFDKNCHRLGYGYGHYDYFLSRYFETNPGAKNITKLIGIGYDEQIFEDLLPFEDHDIQLNEIITQSQRIKQLK